MNVIYFVKIWQKALRRSFWSYKVSFFMNVDKDEYYQLKIESLKAELEK